MTDHLDEVRSSPRVQEMLEKLLPIYEAIEAERATLPCLSGLDVALAHSSETLWALLRELGWRRT